MCALSLRRKDKKDTSRSVASTVHVSVVGRLQDFFKKSMFVWERGACTKPKAAAAASGPLGMKNEKRHKHWPCRVTHTLYAKHTHTHTRY